MESTQLTSHLRTQLEETGITPPSDLSKLVAQLPIYYTSFDSKFHFVQADGRFGSLPYQGLDAALRASGVKFPAKDVYLFVEGVRSEIIKNNGVDLALTLAGHPAGAVTLKDGTRLLITKGFKMICPEAGDPDPLLKFLWNFCGKREEQYFYLLSWLQIAVVNGLRCVEVGVEKARLLPSQLLAIVGPPGAGKTLFVTLISELFDGTIRNPYPAFSGATGFKGDLASAFLLVMDDSAESVRADARHKLAKNIKEFLVVPQRRFEAKFKDGFTAPTFQRVIMLGNEDSLGVFPAPEPAFLDKYALLHAYSSEDVSAIRDEDVKEAWMERYRQALPAFAHYLIHEFKIPEEMVDPRYGVKAYKDPDLLNELSNADTDHELLRCLREYYMDGGNAVTAGKVTVAPSPANPGKFLWMWEGYSREFQVLVAQLPPDQGWKLEFRNRHSAGILVKNLAEQYPDVMQRGTTVRGSRRWKLRFECSEPPLQLSKEEQLQRKAANRHEDACTTGIPGLMEEDDD